MRQLVHVTPHQSDDEAKRVIQHRVIQSSLLLQQSLYYNFFFSFVYGSVSVFVLRWKVINGYTGWRMEMFTPYLFAVWIPVELGRLYVGYTGNLHENVPNLAAFIFLTIFPQLIICIYNLWIQHPMLPFDKICAGLMFILLLFQIGAGARAANRIIDNKTARFAVEYEFDEERAPLNNRGNDSNATMATSVAAGVSRWGDVRASQQQQPAGVEMTQFADAASAASPTSSVRSPAAGGNRMMSPTSAASSSPSTPSRPGTAASVTGRHLAIPGTPSGAAASAGGSPLSPGLVQRALSTPSSPGVHMGGTTEVELSRASSITSGALSQRRAEHARQLADKHD